MKSNLYLDIATLSSTDYLATDSSGIYLAKINYVLDSSHVLYLDDEHVFGYGTDLAGFATGIQVVGALGNYRNTESGATGSGKVFYFSGESLDPDYVKIDSYSEINRSSNFTIKALVNSSVDSKSTIVVSRTGDKKNYELYLEDGVLHFDWLDSQLTYRYSSSSDEVTTNSQHAVAVSILPDEVWFGVDGNISSQSTDNGYIYTNKSPLYVGGDPVELDNFFNGTIGKFQILNTAVTDFSSFISDQLYYTGSPYADITIVDLDEISDPGFQPYMLELGRMNDHNCDFGLLLRTGSIEEWAYPTITGSWQISSDGLSDYVSIDQMNEGLELLTDSYTRFWLRVFFLTDGLSGGGISSGIVHYVDNDEPISISSADSLIYNKDEKIFSKAYAKRLITDSSYSVSYTIEPGGDIVHAPVMSESWQNGLYGLRDSTVEIDSVWGDPRELVTTQANYSITKTVYLGDGVFTASQAIAVTGHTVTFTVYNELEQLDSPTVNINYVGETPYWNALDNYSTSSSGAIAVTLIPGTYEFSVTAENGTVFNLTSQITTDSDLVFGVPTNVPRNSFTGNRVTRISSDMEHNYFATGDTPTLTFQIYDPDTGLSKNLSGYTVLFSMTDAYSTLSVVSRRSCTVVSPANGKASLKLSSSDTSTPGTYIGEVSISSSDEKLTSFPRHRIDIITGLN